jgi:methionyl-tRNA synthetase
LYERFGADAFRYFFMRECPFTGDGDFSYERFIAVYNSDLANNLGNLYSRTVTMCLRYFEGLLAGSGAIPAGEVFAETGLPTAVRQIQAHIEQCEYNLALALIWQRVLDPANRYIDRTKPFELAKKDREACRRVLVNLADALRVAAILTKPFIPAASQTVYGGFNYSGDFAEARFEHTIARPAQGTDLHVTARLTDGKVAPLFPRIEPQPES